MLQHRQKRGKKSFATTDLRHPVTNYALHLMRFLPSFPPSGDQRRTQTGTPFRLAFRSLLRNCLRPACTVSNGNTWRAPTIRQQCTTRDLPGTVSNGNTLRAPTISQQCTTRDALCFRFIKPTLPAHEAHTGKKRSTSKSTFSYVEKMRNPRPF